MRKNLLKYVRVREFAPEAEFSDPCPSLILPNVICRYAKDLSAPNSFFLQQKYQYKLAKSSNFTISNVYDSVSASLTLSIGSEGSYCDDCQDLDLCRDSALLAQEWRCGVAECGQPYNQEVIENILIQIVQKRERAYHVQDLVCVRCKQVKVAHLWEQCDCAGTFNCKDDGDEFFSDMRILFDVATRQGFQLLQEFTLWILDNGL